MAIGSRRLNYRQPVPPGPRLDPPYYLERPLIGPEDEGLGRLFDRWNTKRAKLDAMAEQQRFLDEIRSRGERDRMRRWTSRPYSYEAPRPPEETVAPEATDSSVPYYLERPEEKNVSWWNPMSWGSVTRRGEDENAPRVSKMVVNPDGSTTFPELEEGPPSRTPSELDLNPLSQGPASNLNPMMGTPWAPPKRPDMLELMASGEGLNAQSFEDDGWRREAMLAGLRNIAEGFGSIGNFPLVGEMKAGVKPPGPYIAEDIRMAEAREQDKISPEEAAALSQQGIKGIQPGMPWSRVREMAGGGAYGLTPYQEARLASTSRSQDLREEELRGIEDRAGGRNRRYALQAFNGDKSVVGSREGLRAGGVARELLLQKTAQADSSIWPQMAKLMGDVGNLSRTDQEQHKQRIGVVNRIEDFVNRELGGRISDEQRNQLFGLIDAMANSHRRNIEVAARRYSQQYGILLGDEAGDLYGMMSAGPEIGEAVSSRGAMVTYEVPGKGTWRGPEEKVPELLQKYPGATKSSN